MPAVPSVLMASGFRGERPKVVANEVAARAVGGVYGIYGLTDEQAANALTDKFRSLRLSRRIVQHAHGFRKLEVHQVNTLLRELLGKDIHSK